MKVVQVTESKLESLTDCASKMLHYGGKLMTCLEELGGEEYSEEGYGERGYGDGGYAQRMGHRGSYGRRMARREPAWNEMDRFPGNNPYYRSDGELSERRGMDGRYM